MFKSFTWPTDQPINQRTKQNVGDPYLDHNEKENNGAKLSQAQSY